MDRKLKAAKIKKTVEKQTKITTKTNPHLLHVAEFEAGELYDGVEEEGDNDNNGDLYEGVTNNAPVDSTADYRMITLNSETTNSQSS